MFRFTIEWDRKAGAKGISFASGGDRKTASTRVVLRAKQRNGFTQATLDRIAAVLVLATCVAGDDAVFDLTGGVAGDFEKGDLADTLSRVDDKLSTKTASQEVRKLLSWQNDTQLRIRRSAVEMPAVDVLLDGHRKEADFTHLDVILPHLHAADLHWLQTSGLRWHPPGIRMSTAARWLIHQHGFERKSCRASWSDWFAGSTRHHLLLGESYSGKTHAVASWARSLADTPSLRRPLLLAYVDAESDGAASLKAQIVELLDPRPPQGAVRHRMSQLAFPGKMTASARRQKARENPIELLRPFSYYPSATLLVVIDNLEREHHAGALRDLCRDIDALETVDFRVFGIAATVDPAAIQGDWPTAAWLASHEESVQTSIAPMDDDEVASYFDTLRTEEVGDALHDRALHGLAGVEEDLRIPRRLSVYYQTIADGRVRDEAVQMMRTSTPEFALPRKAVKTVSVDGAEVTADQLVEVFLAASIDPAATFLDLSSLIGLPSPQLAAALRQLAGTKSIEPDGSVYRVAPQRAEAFLRWVATSRTSARMIYPHLGVDGEQLRAVAWTHAANWVLRWLDTAIARMTGNDWHSHLLRMDKGLARAMLLLEGDVPRDREDIAASLRDKAYAFASSDHSRMRNQSCVLMTEVLDPLVQMTRGHTRQNVRLRLARTLCYHSAGRYARVAVAAKEIADSERVEPVLSLDTSRDRRDAIELGFGAYRGNDRETARFFILPALHRALHEAGKQRMPEHVRELDDIDNTELLGDIGWGISRAALLDRKNGDFVDAAHKSRIARDIGQRIEDPDLQLRSWDNLCLALDSDRRINDAYLEARACLEVARRHQHDHHRPYVYALRLLGNRERKLGEFEAALSHVWDAACEATRVPDHAEAADQLDSVAEVLGDWGHHEHAVAAATVGIWYAIKQNAGTASLAHCHSTRATSLLFAALDPTWATSTATLTQILGEHAIASPKELPDSFADLIARPWANMLDSGIAKANLDDKTRLRIAADDLRKAGDLVPPPNAQGVGDDWLRVRELGMALHFTDKGLPTGLFERLAADMPMLPSRSLELTPFARIVWEWGVAFWQKELPLDKPAQRKLEELHGQLRQGYHDASPTRQQSGRDSINAYRDIAISALIARRATDGQALVESFRALLPDTVRSRLQHGPRLRAESEILLAARIRAETIAR